MFPYEVYGTLLDENGRYLCSVRTMYRILKKHGETTPRGRQRVHTSYKKPELLATAPRVLAIQAVGSDIEAALNGETQDILLADLGVTKTHARPYTSNDNPFSEAQFKTVKYRPDYPAQFGSLQDARAWARPFFHWYNQQHRHSALALLTPAMVHAGRGGEQVMQQRQQVLNAAFQTHPERFVCGQPQPGVLPEAVWINPPTSGKPSIRDKEPRFCSFCRDKRRG